MSTKNKRGWIFLFALPCVILFCIVYAIPFIMVMITSLCNYTLTQSPTFLGLDNFKTIFADQDFRVSIINTLKWVVIQSTLHVLMGFMMALILRRKPKGWKFARVAYVIPNIIPTAATAVMYSLLLNPTFGVVKMLYEKLGIDTMQVVNLFGNSKYAFWTVTATWVFYSGFNMLIFLGEMGAISPEIYEAAQVDGATAGQADRYITIPMMKNAFGTCVILASVAMVSQFDIIYMTTRGGPGNSTLNLPMYLYKIITLENNYGKANAVGVIQIILGLVLVILIQRLFNQKKEIEEV